jgi:putative transposase
MSHSNHRKLVKHFDIPGHAHELTFSCFRRIPLLHHDVFTNLLSEAIDRAMVGQGFLLLAFVYMPEHVHLLVIPHRIEASVSSLLSAIKRPSSYRIKLWMQQHDTPMLERLTITERPGKATFRFWQEGSGYDRNLTEPGTLRQAVDYIHANPVRRGLVSRESDWHWSSWHHFYGDGGRKAGLPTVHNWPDGW